MFQFNAVGILGVVAVAACWALAVMLFRVGTSGSVARKLAILLLVEGVTLLSAGYIDMLLNLPDDFYSQYPQWNQTWASVHFLGDGAMFALYPPFLAAALQTTLTRPFAGKRMRIGLAGTSVVLFFTVMSSPVEVGTTLLYLMMSLLFGFALVASIHAWRVAAAGAPRARARVFALAFGIRDVCWGFIYAISIWMIVAGTYLDGPAEPDLFSTIYALGTLLAVPLIAYGILHAHLFDIDLRIRWTIKQSTLAAVVVVIMFVLSEGAERLLSAEIGNVASLIVAALIVFALTPLQRFAERVASVAMPNTHDTPEYAASRKIQVYEEAVSEAHYEGGISKKERALLVRLRDSLGISEANADAIEGELTKLQPGIA